MKREKLNAECAEPEQRRKTQEHRQECLCHRVVWIERIRFR
jgi:hypothetical protein